MQLEHCVHQLVNWVMRLRGFCSQKGRQCGSESGQSTWVLEATVAFHSGLTQCKKCSRGQNLLELVVTILLPVGLD